MNLVILWRKHMKRNIDLCRKILFAVEEQYVDTAIYNLKIENYSIEQIAYHCKILHDANLIFDYAPFYCENHIESFSVGALTWEGNAYLDKIRNDSIWNKVKDTLREKGLPLTFESTARLATTIIADLLK